MRAVYIHTYIPSAHLQPWRVFEGLLLNNCVVLELPADILFIDDSGAMRIEKERHLKHQMGAAFWVYAHEFELLAEHIEADWKRRHVWQEAYEDVQRLRAEREIAIKPVGPTHDNEASST